jgi:hypothetical protein
MVIGSRRPTTEKAHLSPALAIHPAFYELFSNAPYLADALRIVSCPQALPAAIIRQKGTANYWATSYGLPLEHSEYIKSIPLKPERGTIVGRVLLEGKTVHVPDLLADPEYTLMEAQRRAVAERSAPAQRPPVTQGRGGGGPAHAAPQPPRAHPSDSGGKSEKTSALQPTFFRASHSRQAEHVRKLRAVLWREMIRLVFEAG